MLLGSTPGQPGRTLDRPRLLYDLVGGELLPGQVDLRAIGQPVPAVPALP